MASVVFDTSVVLRLILPSQQDAAAVALWRQCVTSDLAIAIPSQGISEAMAQLRRHVSFRRLTANEGDRIFEELHALVGALQIELVQLGAWDVAKRFSRPDTYDAEFYSLAENLGAALWTADDRFVNAMGQERPAWVKRLADFEPASLP